MTGKIVIDKKSDVWSSLEEILNDDETPFKRGLVFYEINGYFASTSLGDSLQRIGSRIQRSESIGCTPRMAEILRFFFGGNGGFARSFRKMIGRRCFVKCFYIWGRCLARIRNSRFLNDLCVL